MIFTSVTFLFIFLPLTLLCLFAGHFLYDRSNRTGTTLQNSILLIASLIFYYIGAQRFFLLILFSTGLDYCGGLIQARSQSKRVKQVVVSVSVFANLLLLAYFKYANFFIANINAILEQLQIPPTPYLALTLPIGISFYTFQTISYQIDLYRGRIQCQRNIVDFSLFVTLFPQLVAGPIVRYRDIEKQITARTLSLHTFSYGIYRFSCGLIKKVLVADQLAPLVEYLFTRPPTQVSMYAAWLGCWVFALQIYYDFSGYSDMAIGLGKFFGFTLPENFNYPFAAKNLTTFWMRWHMTLMTWLRDYLLAGLRKLPGGKKARSRNLLLVFLLCGFWHGAKWTFILWGLFHGFFFLLERAGLTTGIQKLPTYIQPSYPLLIFVVSAVFFRATSLEQSFLFLQAMMGLLPHATLDNRFQLLMDSEMIATIGFATFFSFPILPFISQKLLNVPDKNSGWSVLFLPIRPVAQVTLYIIFVSLLLYSLASIIAMQKNSFIYFQF